MWRAVLCLTTWLALGCPVALVAEVPTPEPEASTPRVQRNPAADVGTAPQPPDDGDAVVGKRQAKIAERDKLWAKANELRRSGKFAQAAKFGEQVVSIEEEVLGEDHAKVVASHRWLAEIYESAEDWTLAKSQREAVLDWCLAQRDEQHYETIDARLAVQHVTLLKSLTLDQRQQLQRAKKLGEEVVKRYGDGQYAEALKLAMEVRDIRKNVLGDEQPDYVHSLNNLAVLYSEMGDSARAEPLYIQALEIRKRILSVEHPDYASGLNNLALLYAEIGDSARAEPLYTQALEIRKKVLKEEHPAYAHSLNNLAVLYHEMGDLARAEPLYAQALKIRRKVLSKEHPDYATSLNNLAGLYETMGDYARTEPLYKQALEINKNALGNTHPNYAAGLNNLANLYHDMGDYARAEPLYTQALEITTEHLERSATSQTEQQQLLQGHHVVYQLESHLANLMRLERRHSTAYAAVLRWKGATLVRQRAARIAASDPKLAPLFTQLQQVTRQWAALATCQFPPEQRERIQERITDLTKQKETLERELSRASAAFRTTQEIVTPDQIEASLPTNTALVNFFEYRHNEPSKSEKGKWDFTRRLLAFVSRSSHEVTMHQLGEVAPIQTHLDTWREHVEGDSTKREAAGQALRKALWEPLLKDLEGVDTVLISPDGALGQLPFAALPGKEPDTYLIEDYKLALVPVPRLLPTLLGDKSDKLLPKDLLVMGGIDYDHCMDVTPPVPLAEESLFAGPSRSAREVTDGRTWKPLPGTAGEASFIQSLYTQQLKRSPDRIVFRTTSEATEEQFREHAGSCHVLHLATHGYFAQPDKKSALGPDAVAAAEKRSRGNLFGERHAQVQGYSPGLLSGLVFAGANSPPPQSANESEKQTDDGYLTADEIAFLPLEGVKLVVLSACETGLGEVAGGEGLLGIQRSFQVSGARTTIATQWKVNDPATQTIMQRFYENFLQGRRRSERADLPKSKPNEADGSNAVKNSQPIDKATQPNDPVERLSALDALREAQLWALRNPNNIPRGADAPEPDQPNLLPPYYWAAFTISGDWR